MVFLCRTFCPFLFILHVLSLPLSFLSSYSQRVLFCQIHTSHYLFIYLFIHQIFIECLLCARKLARCWRHRNKQKDKALPLGTYILVIGSALEWNSDNL